MQGRHTGLFVLSLFIGCTSVAFARGDRTQDEKITAHDAEESDRFGTSVAAVGDTLVIGASQDDDNDHDSGSVYVYRRIDGTWSLEEKLVPITGGPDFVAGYDVAIDGFVDTALAVGAPAINSPGFPPGVAHIFRRNGSAWTEEATVTGSDGRPDDHFGIAVAISGDLLVAGAPAHDGVGSGAGAAYIFRFDGIQWNEEASLRSVDAEAFDALGTSVAVQGEVVFVGCSGDNIRGPKSGSVFVYEHTGRSWQHVETLVANDGAAGNRFGSSIDIDGTAMVVGARGDSSSLPGAAYVFTKTDGVWTQESKLIAPDGAPGDRFGRSVAVSSNQIVVGADGVDRSEFGPDSGKAYTFRDNGAGWILEDHLIPSQRSSNLFFGESVAISGGVVSVTGSFDDEIASNAGAVFLYDDGPVADCLTLQVTNLIAGEFATAIIRGGEPGQRCALLFGLDDGRAQGQSGDWCVDFGFDVPPLQVGDRVVFAATFDENGEVSQQFFVPGTVSGFDARFQAALKFTCPDECMSNVWRGIVQ